jgi:hypothetical protein
LIAKCLRVLCLLLISCTTVHADIGLILGETISKGLSQWTNSGHAAVYLSRLCPASPIRLRLCETGESGSVINNYDRFDEDSPYEWNAVPFNVFLYGTENPEFRPLYASVELRKALQERYLEQFLNPICAGRICTTDPNAGWRELVAANFARGIYIFVVKTTLQQDLRLMAELNSQPNVNRYSGVTNNCANFAARIVNTYFPHSAKADHVNDFGMTSPKAISKSFVHFAVKHPELELHVMHIPQLPGDFPPSADCRKGTEVLFRSKRWLLPILYREPHELVLFTVSYLLTGRFNPQHEFERRPETEIGAPEAWRTYRQELKQLVASENPETVSKAQIHRLARSFDSHAQIVTEAAGAAWVQIAEDGAEKRVGVTQANITTANSDPESAYLILLARTKAELKSSAKRRESLTDFSRDWNLLQASRESLHAATQQRSNSLRRMPACTREAATDASEPERLHAGQGPVDHSRLIGLFIS